MRENSRFECLANIRRKKENRAYSIKMVALFHNVEAKKMSPAKSPNILGFFATQTAIFLCTKTQM